MVTAPTRSRTSLAPSPTAWAPGEPGACPPTYRLAQAHSTDMADIAAGIGTAAGYDLLPWQLDVLRDWSAVGPDGKWLHKRCGLSVPRQNGKSVDGIVWALTLALMCGAVVLWTEHNYSTTVEMLRRFQDVLGQRPGDRVRGKRFFNRHLKRVNSKTAQEAFFLDNGGSIHFSTRTASAALGYSFDAVFYDEAQLLSDEHVQTIAPTTTAGKLKNLQEVYLGTPPRPGGAADVFRRLRAEAREGKASDLSWSEWSVKEIGDVRDERRWYRVNPSLGAVADAAPIRSHAGSMLPLSFAQEHLGYWLPEVTGGVIDPGAWGRAQVGKDEAAARLSAPGTRRAYGVKFSPDGARVALAVAYRPAEGPRHVELVSYRGTEEGTRWLADWLAERKGKASAAVLDGRAGAQALAERLAGRVPRKFLALPRSRDAVAAAAGLDQGLREGTVTHLEDGALARSALSATRRRIGSDGGWGFGGEDSAPVEACALALWGVMTSKRDPERVQKAGFWHV